MNTGCLKLTKHQEEAVPGHWYNCLMLFFSIVLLLMVRAYLARDRAEFCLCVQAQGRRLQEGDPRAEVVRSNLLDARLSVVEGAGGRRALEGQFIGQVHERIIAQGGKPIGCELSEIWANQAREKLV